MGLEPATEISRIDLKICCCLLLYACADIYANRFQYNDLETKSQAVARIAYRNAIQQTHARSYAKNYKGHLTYATPTFRENYLCARSVFPIQSCIPNLMSLAQVVFDILRSKRIGVTSLTFQGHVTSSVTRPFDSPYAISYWCSIVIKPLSLMVSEIFNVKCNVMVDMTLIQPLNKGQGHSFWYQSISHVRLPIGSQ